MGKGRLGRLSEQEVVSMGTDWGVGPVEAGSASFTEPRRGPGGHEVGPLRFGDGENEAWGG